MDIKDLRNEIDKIDTELAELFLKRMDASRKVAEYKIENDMPVFNSAREREIINKVTEDMPKELESYAKTLWSTLFDLSRSYQRKIINPTSKLSELLEKAVSAPPVEMPGRAIVACQGVEGAYSQIACSHLFEYPTIMYFSTFDKVFTAVESGLCKYGILPLENSNAGSVNAVYDLMNKHNCYVTASTRLCIDHKIMVPKGVKKGEIREIFSHKQAIDQCSKYLDTLKDVKVTVCENTAVAAKMVAECGRKDVAAIGSKDCSSLYGLDIIDENIQNSDNNYTRFICISKEPEIYAGASKTALVMTLPNKPGTLYNIIARFAALGLNLTKLESRPKSGSNFEFMFYFDIDASIYNENLKTILCELENDCDTFSYLGSYIEK
ncbi:MAG: chorismate mutase [Clostridia bacterium]|nr:chorismate mutase [Clostridia bacterium]